MPMSIEITAPDGSLSTRVVTGPLVIGREGDVAVSDPSMSRRHATIDVGDDGALVITDHQSSNGTLLNGVRVSGNAMLRDRDRLVLGDTVITVQVAAHDGAGADGEVGCDDATGADGPMGVAGSNRDAAAMLHHAAVRHPSQPDAAVARRVQPATSSLMKDLVEVRFVPGTAGARAAASVLDTARRARTALAGFGSEAWGSPVVINVVDPFPDPADPARLVTSGAVVDSERGEIWLAVTPESPPEDPHRALALLFGAVLPAAGALDHLIEGYGRYLASGARARDGLPSIGGALADLEEVDRAAYAPSFVAYLIGREGVRTFLQLLASPADRLSESWTKLYGRPEAALEAAWNHEQSRDDGAGRTGEFLRMSWRYLRPYRWRQAEVFAWMLLSLGFTVVYPFVTMRLFDRAIPSGEMSQVTTLLAALSAAFVISLLAGLRQSYQSAWVAGSVVTDLRSELFAKVQRLPDRWLVQRTQGDMLSRLMNDVSNVQGGLSTAINDGVFQVVSLAVSTVIMLQIDLVLGLIVLAGAPLVAVVYRRMSAGARRISLAVQEDAGAVVELAAENYQASPVVKMFRLAGSEQARFARASQRQFRSVQRLTLYGGLFGLSVDAIMTAIRIVVLGLGTWLIFEGRFTLGGLVAFLGIMGQVLGPVAGLTGLGQSIQASMGAIVRIEEVLGADPEPLGEDLPPLAPVRREVALRDVSLSYHAERRALDGVDVTIPAGSRVAFVGPSGSGKSTILRVLMRLYEPDDGVVEIDGVDVTTRSLESLRARMGVVFQDSFLFNTTVRENIALGCSGATDAQIMAAAAAAEIDAFVDALPRGYDSMVGEGGRHLSGGQRQRVAIARALVGDPELLLLDEATSALDPATERQINDTLERVGRGRTVIAVTHRLASVANYDRIFVVVGGRIEESGSHDELVARRGVYARLWAEQTGVELPDLPETPSFDPMPVLAGVPMFREVEAEVLDDVIDHLRPVSLAAGEVMMEGGGRLAVVAEGIGEISGAGEPARSVGPGDLFGLDALLGRPHGTELRAQSRMRLLVLEQESWQALTLAHPALDDARTGRSTIAGPAGGRTLSGARITVSGTSPGGAAITAGAVAEAVRVAQEAAMSRRTIS